MPDFDDIMVDLDETFEDDLDYFEDDFTDLPLHLDGNLQYVE